MALMRWSPLEEMSRLRDEMDRVFQQLVPVGETRLLPVSERWMPSVDVFERDGNLVVEAELPGMKKEEVDIHVEDHSLVLTGETKREEEKREEGYYRRERHYGRFERVVPLPAGVKTEEAKAKFENGVLQVEIPRSEEAKGRKIPIH